VVPDDCDTARLLWAHDMYLSRRFPSELGDTTTSDGASAKKSPRRRSPNAAPPVAAAATGSCSALTNTLGVLVPLLDFMNHRQSVTSRHTNDGEGE
jgi:hypothetical protein